MMSWASLEMCSLLRGAAMVDKVRAAVLVGPRQVEIKEFPMPETAPDSGVLKVEATGLVGGDYEIMIPGGYDVMIPGGSRYPAIPGHIIVGRIHSVGDVAAARWGVRERDRVLMHYDVPCLYCRRCRTGNQHRCESIKMYGLWWGFDYGKPPYLWGGAAEYMALHPNSYMSRLPDDVDPARMCLLERLADGHNWLINEGQLTAYEPLVIIGAGALGHGAILVGKLIGAHPVIMIAREGSSRIDQAQIAGADYVFAGPEEEVVEQVAAATQGRMAGVVIDVTVPDAQEVTRLAVRLAGFKGRILQVPVRKSGELTGVLSRAFMENQLTLRNVWGHRPQDTDQAASLVHRPEIARLNDLKLSTTSLDAVDEWLRPGSADGAVMKVIRPWE